MSGEQKAGTQYVVYPVRDYGNSVPGTVALTGEANYWGNASVYYVGDCCSSPKMVKDLDDKKRSERSNEHNKDFKFSIVNYYFVFMQ